MEKNQICYGKGENKMMDYGVREKLKMQMVEEGRKSKYEITTDLFSR
jgi:hypothetical protein